MSKKKIFALRRYSEIARISNSTTGDLDEDSTVFNKDDRLWYQRMDKGKYKGLLRPSMDISHAVESSAVLDSDTDIIDPPPKNWYKNLEKYDKSIINSPDMKNSGRRSTNIPPNNTEESISKEIALDSDSDEMPPRRKRTNLRALLKDDSNTTNAFREAFADEPSNIEAVNPGPSEKRISASKSSFLSAGDSFNKAKKRHSESADFEKSSGPSYTENVHRTNKPKKLRKLRNFVKRPTENAFKNFFDEESSSSSSTVEQKKNSLKTSNKTKSILENFEEKTPDIEGNISKRVTLNSDSDELPPRRKRTNLRALLKDDSNGTNAFPEAFGDEPSNIEEMNPGPSEKRKSASKTSFLSGGNSFNKAQKSHSESADFEKSSEQSYTEKVHRTDKPRNLQKLVNVLNKPTENAFKNFFDEESSSNVSSFSTKKQKNNPLETSNKTKSIRNSDISLSRKRKSNDSESSHNSSLSKKKTPMESESSHNSSRSLSMKLRYCDNSNTFTQSQRQKSKDVNHSFGLSQSLNDERIRKSGPGANVSLASNLENKISPVEGQKEISITESSNSDIQREKRLLNVDRESTSVNDFENSHSSGEDSNSDNSQTEVAFEKSEKRNHEQSQNKENLSSVSNRQSLTDNNSDSEIDVESRNEETTKSKKEEYYQTLQVGKISQSDKPHNIPEPDSHNLLDSEEDDEDLISIGTHSNKNSITGTKQKLNSSTSDTRFSKSIQKSGKQSMADQLSILNEAPQYESTRKMDLKEFRNSPRKSEAVKDSRLSNMETNEEDSQIPQIRKSRENWKARKSAAHNISRNLKDAIDEEEESDYHIQVTNPTINTSAEKESNTLNLGEKSKKSEARKSRNRSKMDEQTSRNIDNSSVQTGEDNDSEKSLTVSLSEGESLGNKTPSEESRGEVANASSTSFDKIHQKKSSPERNNEEAIRKIDPVNNQPVKPKITNFEILKPNDIDLNKLKDIRKLPTKENVSNLHSERIVSSEMSKESENREASPSKSASKLNIFSNNSRVSDIEEAFSRMHGVEDEEIPSTSDGRTHNSQSLYPENISNKSKSSQKNDSLTNLRRTLDSNEESDNSVSPLMTYLQNSSQVNSDNQTDISGKEKSKDPVTPETVGGAKGQQMQKVVHDFFKPKAKKISAPKPIMKPIVDNRGLVTFSELEKDKGKKEEFFKIFAENKVKWQKDLDDEVKAQAKAMAKEKENESQMKKRMAKAAQNKKKPSKPVDKAFLVNGVVYKPPKLPRPMFWATDRLYKHIWKMIEPKYQMRTRVKSEEFVINLGQVYKKVMRRKLYKNYETDLENLMKEMAEMGLIVHRKDFNDFCISYLPISFREKAIPMLLPGNKMSIPYEPSKLYTPLI